jgi:hypothetical protein
LTPLVVAELRRTTVVALSAQIARDHETANVLARATGAPRPRRRGQSLALFASLTATGLAAPNVDRWSIAGAATKATLTEVASRGPAALVVADLGTVR